jgi:competence protein ComEA
LGGVAAWLERHQLLVVALAALVLAGAIGLRAVHDDGLSSALVLREGSSLADGEPIRVHVVGAVLRPGVFTLREGDRVAEAMSAAGGPANDADLDAVNLARRLRDGEQLTVPQVKGRTPAASSVPLAPGARLNLNTATEAQLDLLPGIGQTYARRIVDSRGVDGPFKSPRDLLDRRVLPKATFDKVSDLIMVAPP